MILCTAEQPDRRRVGELSAATAVAHSRALELTATAKGMETEQRLRVLSDLNWRRTQALYLGRPISAAALTELIVTSTVRPVR